MLDNNKIKSLNVTAKTVHTEYEDPIHHLTALAQHPDTGDFYFTTIGSSTRPIFQRIPHSLNSSSVELIENILDSVPLGHPIKFSDFIFLDGASKLIFL